LKQCSKQSTIHVVLLALACLLAACGGGATGSAPPTLGPTVQATQPAAPTQPAQPTAAAPTAAILPTAVIPPTAAAAPTAAAPTAAILPTAATQAGAANLLISYHKSGGIAGINETLSVYADGKTELRGKSGTVSAQADPSAIQALQKLLASPEFTALQVPVQPPGADQFVYELTVPGRGKPIVATDGADNPAVLRQLIEMLEQLKKQTK